MKVDLTIGYWQLGIWAYGTHCNDMLEWPPNNIFPVHNSQCPKQPSLNQLCVYS